MRASRHVPFSFGGCKKNDSRTVKGLRKDLGTMVKRVQELDELVISWKRIAEKEREDKLRLLEMM